MGDVGRAVEFASETQENQRSRVASEVNVDRIRSWELSFGPTEVCG